MKKLEERYWELREAVDRAKDRMAMMPYSVKAADDYANIERKFYEYCADMLEVIMEEHSDVLKRLKEI